MSVHQTYSELYATHHALPTSESCWPISLVIRHVSLFPHPEYIQLLDFAWYIHDLAIGLLPSTIVSGQDMNFSRTLLVLQQRARSNATMQVAVCLSKDGRPIYTNGFITGFYETGGRIAIGLCAQDWSLMIWIRTFADMNNQGFFFIIGDKYCPGLSPPLEWYQGVNCDSISSLVHTPSPEASEKD